MAEAVGGALLRGPYAPDPVRVLHVTGSGRSGSTLLTSTLGCVPGVFAAGEVRFLWERALIRDEPCGCGRSARECEVWSEVLQELGADGDGTSAKAFHEQLHDLTRLRHGGRFFLRRRPLGPGEIDLAMKVQRVYEALARRTGANLIIDSSKLPTYAALLDEVPGIELFVLHLVRDPRAAAYSWTRGRSTNSVEPMDEMSAFKSAALWSTWNALAAHRWAGRPRYLRMRYEDVMSNPRSSLTTIAEFAGIDSGALPFVSDDEVELHGGHVVAGNPNRLDRGPIRFRTDTRWETGLSRRDRLTVTAVCASQLHRMGYSWRA